MNRYADKEFFRKPQDYRLISKTKSNYVHIDAFEKVTGKAKYAGDFNAPGCYELAFVHSPYAHAKILSVDTSAAEALPGVKCVLTGKDFSDIRVGGHGRGADDGFTGDVEILCKDQVRMVYDPVACVCAVDAETAAEGVKLIKVEYEELPIELDPIHAMEDDAIDVQGYGKNNHNLGPCCHQVGTNDGRDIDEEFAKAAYVQSADYHTHRIVHAPIETHASYASYDPEKDEWTVYQSSTMTWADQYWLGQVFGKDESHFHVIRPYVGGAFGGKSNYPFNMFCCCECARRTLHPVRSMLTREEEFQIMHGRHPFDIHIDVAFDETGKLLAKKTVQILNGGAYGMAQVAAVNLSAIWAAFPYKIDAIDLHSKRVFTNTSPNGAMRGYTACQVQFANDINMQYAAEAMGIDPIEFRKRSALESGYHSPAGLVVTSCAFKDTLDDAAKFMDWENRKNNLPKGRGIGFAGTAFVSGTASPILGSPNQVQTNATVRVNWHGIATLYSNCHDNGQGADTTMCAIVAEELGLDMNEVKFVQPSTFNAGYDSGAYGSRVTFLGGNAVRRAAVEVKKKLLESVAHKWGVEAHLLDIIDHKIVCRDMGKEDLEMPWKDAVYNYMAANGGDELVGIGSYFHRTTSAQYHGKPSNYAPSYVFSTGAVDLDVDEETGCLDIHHFFFAHDCGQALNPASVEGQLQGSIYSGIGYTLFENIIMDDKGKMRNPNFRDYRMLTALDMPPITLKYDYPPDPEGPFGAKECGEGTTAPIAPAIANAVHMATGLHIVDLPLDPENLWRKLKKFRAEQAAEANS